MEIICCVFFCLFGLILSSGLMYLFVSLGEMCSARKDLFIEQELSLKDKRICNYCGKTFCSNRTKKYEG